MEKIMKKIIISAGLSLILVLMACTLPGGQSKLEKLERQRDALSAQIEKLKGEMASVSSPGEPAGKIVSVKTMLLQPAEFKHTIQVQGTIESDNNILVSSQSPGLVEKLHVTVGDVVSKGELLAELDGAILESSIAEVENGLQLASTIFERQQRLWNKNIGSEIEFLQARNNKESLERKLVTLREQYNLTKIKAPISGTVDAVLIKEGEMAAAGFGAFRIVQLSSLKITAELSENYISRLKINDIVRISIPMLGREFVRKINAVSQVIDPDHRTFQIEIKLPAQEKDIKPNMLAVLSINDYTNPEALSIPKEIVQKTGDAQFVFVAIGEKGGWTASRRQVVTGENNQEQVEILSGLNSGEQVITFGYQNIADGQKIMPVDND